MHPLCHTACLLAILAPAPLLAAAPEGSVVYTRADVESATIGEVELRRAYTKTLTLPWWECPGEPFTCEADRIYAQVYSLRFREDSVGSGPSAGRSRGNVYAAINLTADLEDTLEEALTTYLSELSATAYSYPQAATSYGHGPLSQHQLEQSTLPGWLCRELDGEYVFDLVIAEDGKIRRSYGRTSDVAERACRSIERAAEDAGAELFRTAPDVLVQVRHTVRLQSASTLDGLTWADELVKLPEGVTFDKHSTAGKKTGGLLDHQGDFYRGHEGRYHGIERDVLIPRAPRPLQLLERPMWVTRWTFEASRETFGAEPRVENEPTASLVVAVLPVADPTMDEQARPHTPLFVPEASLTEWAIEQLGRELVLGPDVIHRVFNTRERWPASGDWLVVTCSDDGTARYGIAPFATMAPVQNPREACAAIERELGD